MVLDALARFDAIKDEDLSEYLKLSLKDVNKIAAQLKADRLIRADIKAESRAGGKPFQRTFYILDYKLFVDVVKYRMFKLKRNLDEDIKNVKSFGLGYDRISRQRRLCARHVVMSFCWLLRLNSISSVNCVHRHCRKWRMRI